MIKVTNKRIKNRESKRKYILIKEEYLNLEDLDIFRVTLEDNPEYFL